MMMMFMIMIIYIEDLLQTSEGPVLDASVSKLICAFLSGFRALFSGVSILWGLLQSFHFHFREFPELLEKEFDGHFPFRFSVCIMSICGSLYLVPSSAYGSLTDFIRSLMKYTHLYIRVKVSLYI